MRIACSRCQAQYNLPDEKLERGAAKIRCTQCGHVFVVKRRSAEPPPVVVMAEARFDDFTFEAPASPASPPTFATGDATGFGDFDLGLFEDTEQLGPLPVEKESSADRVALGTSEIGELAPPALSAADNGLGFGSLDLGSIDLADSPGEVDTGTGQGDGFDDFGFSDASELSTSPPSVTEKAGSFDDFESGFFEDHGTKGATDAPGPAERSTLNEKLEEDGFLSSTDELPALGELDLGEFDDGGANLGFDEPQADRRGRDAAQESMERVNREDLVSASTREVPLQGLAEDIPRLDLQKGPRRAEAGGKRSPLLARDRRRSPLFWVVVVAVLGTGGYTGYNAYWHPEAFTGFNPQRIRELWRNRDVEARFATEDVKGFGQDLPGGRRVFVIRGRVVNKSGTAQGLIRVKGNLFGRDGSPIATSEVYCGNLLSDHELAALPRATIEARLRNQVGEALSNVDIAPGGKVPFMLVFPAPPGKVENFNVLVSAWRAGSGS
jgi:predicted Zn finger-like uncharacterized protein